MDVNSSIIREFSSLALDSFYSLLNDQIVSKEVLESADRFVKLIVLLDIKAQQAKTLKILRKLLERAGTLKKIFFYLKLMKKVHPLNQPEDFDSLYLHFEKLCTFGDYINALQVLQFFTGKMTIGDPFSKFIEEMINKKKWAIACEAIALESFNGDMKEDSIKVIEELLKQRIPPHLLQLIFLLIHKYSIAELSLLSRCYEKCEGIADNELADRMWNVFLNLCLANPSQDFQSLENVERESLKCFKIPIFKGDPEYIDRPRNSQILCCGCI